MSNAYYVSGIKEIAGILIILIGRDETHVIQMLYHILGLDSITLLLTKLLLYTYTATLTKMSKTPRVNL